MDRIIALIVHLISLLAGHAWVLPGFKVAQYRPGDKVKVLLAGYNGARNTGSDTRVAALAEQVSHALGPHNVELSVMSFDLESTTPYFQGIARQVPFSTIFFMPLLRACCANHVVILCEGSTFKSKFADALTLYSCEAAGIMRAQGKPCIAYGGEVGQMTPFVERTVRRLCADVRFIARSAASYEAASRLGMQALQGTDTAWTFDSSKGRYKAVQLLSEAGWDTERPLLGIAPVNPYWWPVKPSLLKWMASALADDRFHQFQKWYFFSWSEARNKRYQRYLDDMAAACSTFSRENGYMPVVVGMEKLDEDACYRLAQRLGNDVPVILSKHHDGFVIGEVLRSLSLLVTSRYHAQVLATGARVPTVAVSMDERLENLAEELKTPDELLLSVDQPDLAARILIALDYAYDNRGVIADKLQASRTELMALLGSMQGWLVDYLAEYDIAVEAVQDA